MASEKIPAGYAAFAGVFGLILIFTGAIVTANQPELFIGGRGHAIVACIALAATVPLVLRPMGWIALLALVGDAAVTGFTIVPPLATPLNLLHAILAPVYVAALVLSGSTRQADTVDPDKLVSLRFWVMFAPVLVLIQILFGASYRHKILGVMPHMAGAALVALMLMIVPVQLMQRFPEHQTLRRVSVAALSVVLTQITLGIVAFVMRLLEFDTTPAFAYLAAAHLTVGAVTLAVALRLAIDVRCAFAAPSQVNDALNSIR